MKFPIPESALTQHIAVLGMTGSGKTSTEKLVIEHVVAGGARVCILDTLKSDWWGITSSASGKSPGLPFKILGGPRGHLPLHSSAGKAIGQLVGSGKLPLSIIDMSDFEAGGIQRFFVDFAQSLWKNMRGVLYLPIEEAHEIAPKERAGFNQENMAIHWAKKLATGSRTKGIRLVVATQRVQALHNAVLGSCGTLIAHRVMYDADQEPIIKWLKGTKKDVAGEIGATLSSLQDGEGWLCSGREQIFERIAFPKFKTFDNTATPTGDEADIDIKTATVDQDELRAIIGDAVKEAIANDPTELKKQIRELQRDLTTAKAKNPDVEQIRAADLRRQLDHAKREGIDVGVHSASAAIAGKLAAVVKAGDDMIARLRAIAEEAAAAPAPTVPHRATTIPRQIPSSQLSEASGRLSAAASRALRRVSPTKSHSNGAGESLPRAERAMLTVLAQHPAGRSRVQLALLSGYSQNSSSFANALGALRSAGYVNRGEPIAITDAGLTALGDWQPLPTGRELIDHWKQNLGAAERRMLEVLVERYPSAMSKDDLSEASGYSVTSSSFANALGRLRSLELVNRGPEIRASEDLF